MRRGWTLVAAVVPPLLLAALGSTHPALLTPQSAGWWHDLHVVGLVTFPLLALGPWAVVRAGRPRGRAGAGAVGVALEGVVVVLGVVYAASYTALDTLAGIGAGALTVAVGPGPWVSTLFGQADLLVLPGVWSYLAATALAGITAVATAHGPGRLLGVVGGLIALGGAYSFLTSHIYYPVGVATMVVLAVGHGLLALAATRDRAPVAAHAVS